MTGNRPPAPGATARTAPPAPVRRIRSVELFGREGQLIIEHGGREYRLRITSNGRLILTA